jgi:hypothetical protein
MRDLIRHESGGDQLAAQRHSGGHYRALRRRRPAQTRQSDYPRHRGNRLHQLQRRFGVNVIKLFFLRN